MRAENIMATFLLRTYCNVCNIGGRKLHMYKRRPITITKFSTYHLSLCTSLVQQKCHTISLHRLTQHRNQQNHVYKFIIQSSNRYLRFAQK